MAYSARGLRLLETIKKMVKQKDCPSFDVTSNLDKLKILSFKDGYARASFTMDPEMYGANTLSQGFIATVLDQWCSLTLLACENGKFSATSCLTIQHLRPAKIGDKMILEGKPLRLDGYIAIVAMMLAEATGEIIAKGIAEFVEAPEILQKKYIKDIGFDVYL